MSIEDATFPDGVGTLVTAIEMAPGTHTEVAKHWLQEADEGGLPRRELVERLEKMGLTHAAADKAVTRARETLEQQGHFRQVREGNGVRYFFVEHAPE